MIKTSISHPLLIPTVSPGPGMGKIGFVFCPGRKGTGLTSGTWDRDLKMDLATIQAWGASAVISLTEQDELAKVKAQHIGKVADQMHMDWFHLPIRDVKVPDERFLTAWPKVGAILRDRLRSGNNILLHCMGGLGRSGMVAALLMVELGTHPNRAIEAVRKAHKDLLGPHHSQPIETQPQENFVKQAKSIPELQPSRSVEAIRDRAIGAMVGLAVGDALGTTLEFAKRDDAAPKLTDMVGGGPFRLQPGQWTDDTAMAIALGYSLHSCGKLDEHDLLTRFVAWRREGAYSCTGTCFDIGTTTSAALSAYERTRNIVSGSSSAQSAGNGSLMRLAPIAIRFWDSAEERRDAAIRQSKTTHAASEAIDACVLFADMLADAIAGKTKSEVLAPRDVRFSGRIADIASGAWRAKSRPEIRGRGYVVDALEAALWCVAHTSDYRSAVLMAANLREDADTTAAIAGQLAGALYGAESIPSDWLGRLAWGKEIQRLSRSLFEHHENPIPSRRGPIVTLSHLWKDVPVLEHEARYYLPEPHQAFIRKFGKILIRDNWRVEEYNYDRWSREWDEDSKLPVTYDHLTLTELRDFLTYCYRGDHYCSGLIDGMVRVGAIQKVLLRLSYAVWPNYDSEGPIPYGKFDPDQGAFVM